VDKTLYEEYIKIMTQSVRKDILNVMDTNTCIIKLSLNYINYNFNVYCIVNILSDVVFNINIFENLTD